MDPQRSDVFNKAWTVLNSPREKEGGDSGGLGLSNAVLKSTVGKDGPEWCRGEWPFQQRSVAAHASLGTMRETRQGNKATCWRQSWRQGGIQDVRGWERFLETRRGAGELEKRGAVEAGSGSHGEGGGRGVP